MAIAMALVAAAFSVLRGRRYVHDDDHAEVSKVHPEHEHVGDAALTAAGVPGELAVEDDRI
jgi:hypothetical protein